MIDQQIPKSIRCVALAGNPNSGKTTLFNALTHLRQKVGNYPGVTVEKKAGTCVLPNGQSISIIDLPGTYSLSVRSPDEKIARDVLLGNMRDTPQPDVVVCVVDAGNLERNLYLVSQIQDLGIPVIVALNMMDELSAKGISLDPTLLSTFLQTPVVPMVAIKEEGIDALKMLLQNGFSYQYKRSWLLAPAIEEQLNEIVRLLKHETNHKDPFIFFKSVALISQATLEANQKALRDMGIVLSSAGLEELKKIQDRLAHLGAHVRSAVIEARYQWIRSVCAQASKRLATTVAQDITQRIDAVVTHRVWGWAVFVGIMAFMFYMIFTIAAYPMEWIDSTFSSLAEWASVRIPQGFTQDLIVNGVIAGVGGVVIFLPQILILFFFIGLLQDTGYMARAAFLMDRVMSKVGLHGKSFIPLLSSFACAIPGIMSTRTIESPKDRLTTMLVIPLMSCSARLPVYAVMIAVLIPNANGWEKAGIMLLMYFIGIIGAFIMALVFKKTLLKSQTPVFIMELPPYRFPSWKSVVLQMWERSGLFMKRAGTIILALSIVLWALMTFPKHPDMEGMEALQHSYAGQLGTWMEPALKPLGFDWRIGIGLVGSFAAREVFVSTMNIVFNLSQDAPMESLEEAFAHAVWPDGSPLFTPLVCLVLMVFYVFALQCLSTVAVMWREAGWQWALFQLVYLTGLAYVVSFLIYQIGLLLGFH